MGERYPPGIPQDLDLLVKPTVYEDVFGRGFQNYANAKLVITCWMYALNRYLQKVNLRFSPLPLRIRLLTYLNTRSKQISVISRL